MSPLPFTEHRCYYNYKCIIIIIIIIIYNDYYYANTCTALYIT